jgi:hypothetical protein
MEATEYFEVINNIVDIVIRASGMEFSKMDEQDKQIMGAFVLAF